jgi:hypothetical protein
VLERELAAIDEARSRPPAPAAGGCSSSRGRRGSGRRRSSTRPSRRRNGASWRRSPATAPRSIVHAAVYEAIPLGERRDGARPRGGASPGSRGALDRKIAPALFVTSRAVESHLQHTFQELGIKSRADLPGELRG